MRAVKRICAAYFSPCRNVRTAAEAIGKAAAHALGLPFETVDFTLPQARTGDIAFGPEDLVILGTPVYAGRVPNKIMPFIRDHIYGNGALCVPVVCFGNRAFDDALAELFLLAGDNGFTVLAAAAVVSEHSFAPELAPGRPDDQDLAGLRTFGERIAEKVQKNGPALETVPGTLPPEKYYTPQRADGAPARFLKAVPKTDMEKCTRCGTCAKVCPMGSVDPADPAVTAGVCIKCQACIKLCPAGARTFDDGDFLSHRQMLEANYARPVSSVFCL